MRPVDTRSLPFGQLFEVRRPTERNTRLAAEASSAWKRHDDGHIVVRLDAPDQPKP